MRKTLFLSLILLLSLTALSCTKLKTTLLEAQAMTAYNQGNIDRAIELYKKLVEINPTNGQYHWGLGTAYFSAGKPDNARWEVMQLRKLNRDDLADDLERLLDQ